METEDSTEAARARRKTLWTAVALWFDAGRAPVGATGSSRPIELVRLIPFLLMHLACLAVIWVGVSPVALWTALGLYLVRMFAITGFYHRYFSHRAFKTSRVFQGVMAVVGASAAQRGPLWWAAHHRGHHRHSDQPEDLHSPSQHGLLWSHMGWFMTRESFATRIDRVRDFAGFPELRFLDRFDMVAPAILAGLLYAFGSLLAGVAPGAGTSGAQMLVWGLISTIVLYHATYTINSLAHRFGTRRFDTRDTSRNNFWLAFLTLGEGWHNNHHHHPASVRQGFRWWEVDVAYYLLRILAWLGLVWDLKPVPDHLRRDQRGAVVR